MNSIALRLASAAAVAVTFLSLSGSARADALPIDACQSSTDVGQTCNNAGAQGNEPGICTADTCPHSLPNGDGGFTVTNEPCTLCIASDGGTTTTDGGKPVTTRDDAGTASTPSSSSSSCSMSPSTRDGATAFGMLAIGVLGLALGRRNKRA